MRSRMRSVWLRALPTAVLLCVLGMNMSGQTPFFNYRKYLLGPQSTLSVSVVSVDTTTGAVQINGGDLRSPTTPFIWIWGDGTVNSGWFPSSHTYSDRTRNYHVEVISSYAAGEHDTADVVIRFVPPALSPITLSPVIAVYVPSGPMTLGTRLYPPPAGLVAFADTFFRTTPRTTLEYILTVAATEEREFVNDNMYRFNAKFEEYMLRDPSFGGAYSLWFTNPVAFGVGNGFIMGAIDYSSLFHEMGHNFTLNTPAGYYYGGRIDGNANAVYSESMAQIFQHAAGYEMVNGYLAYGLSEDLMVEIKQQIVRSIKLVRSSYENYISGGKPFATWNNPGTPEDETFGTFMTVAYKFCEHAENAGPAYRQPLKRMMQLMQCFCLNWEQRYDRLNNTAPADTFRATLMVAALSYAFSTDLRSEFLTLNFPISDQIYTELYESAVPIQLGSFTARLQPNGLVFLEWRTISETNNYGFEVQKSVDPTLQFRSIPNCFVPGHGTTTEPQQYSCADSTTSPGRWWYRLKQIDFDGTTHFSDAIPMDVLTGIEVTRVPTAYALHQNYPNPFNPTTTITYSIPTGRDGQLSEICHVTLRVFDILGREVATLVNGVEEAGYKSVPWDARKVSGGVYVYRLQAGQFISTRRMLVLK